MATRIFQVSPDELERDYEFCKYPVLPHWTHYTHKQTGEYLVVHDATQCALACDNPQGDFEDLMYLWEKTAKEYSFPPSPMEVYLLARIEEIERKLKEAKVRFG